jgi:hypothetical protein
MQEKSLSNTFWPVVGLESSPDEYHTHHIHHLCFPNLPRSHHKCGNSAYLYSIKQFLIQNNFSEYHISQQQLLKQWRIWLKIKTPQNQLWWQVLYDGTSSTQMVPAVQIRPWVLEIFISTYTARFKIFHTQCVGMFITHFPCWISHT